MAIYNNHTQIINELKVYSDNRLSIHVDGPGSTERNFKQKPYFKVYNGSNVRNSEIARIYFDEPKYVKDHTGNPTYKLNTSEKKYLCKILNDKVWKELNEKLSRIIEEPVFYKKPDYSLL